ncbi:MAG TPA: hypothetical protein VJV78_43445 [Polyangiales bacterium]|nr:hypothetical protein [Polyangiales bacterium]
MHEASPESRSSFVERVLARLQSAHGAWFVAGIAAVLTLPALTFGFSTDDHVYSYRMRLGMDAWSMFEIASEQVSRARNTGALAWWASPDLKVQFFRPLSALTHILDFSLWPRASWLMHLENSLLYAALVAVVWFLYRELLQSPRIAALAALLFAIDDGHAAAVGWISGRNTVLANCFGFSAVLLHVRSRRVTPVTRGFSLQIASAVCSALALCSAEAGVSTLAYLGAYALIFEHGPLRKRVASVLPALTVFGIWAIAYVGGGFGTRGAGYYRDSGASILVQGVLDLPTWLLSLFGPSVVGPLVALPSTPVRLVALVLGLPLVAALYGGLPRSRENQFLALGALSCLVPLFTTLPQDRLLITASFGAFGLLAGFVSLAKTFTRRVLIALHCVIAPLLFPIALNPARPIDNGAKAIVAAVHQKPAPQVVLVNLPIELLSLYGWYLLLDDPAHPPPSSMQQLYAGASEVVVERIDASTLELRPAHGWGELPIERVFGSPSRMPPTGSEVTLGDMRLRVQASAEDGRPMSVQFRFTSALESPERLWLAWNGRAPGPWRPPAVGQQAVLPALSMFTSLPR